MAITATMFYSSVDKHEFNVNVTKYQLVDDDLRNLHHTKRLYPLELLK